jgi:RNA polymerase sigma-70 factor (ECF subfamily)
MRKTSAATPSTTASAQTRRSAPSPNDDAASARPRRAGRQAASDRTAEREELEHMLRRASEGDQDAWRLIVDVYSGRVFGLIRAQCNSVDLAEEITQSTFCTVVAKIESYTELGRFEQWLFRIAMNRLRDEMRRRKRQARPVEDDALAVLAEGEGPAGGPGGSTRSGGAAGVSLPDVSGPELAALREALTELSESDQHIIHLRHSAGLSFKQIAEVLEQPLGTVLARQHRALKKLAELLRGSLGGDHPLLAKDEAGGRPSGWNDRDGPRPDGGADGASGGARQGTGP